MAKKSLEGGGKEFFQPRTPISHSRGDVNEEHQSPSDTEGFTKGESAIMAALDRMSNRLAKVETAVQSMESKLEGIDARVQQVEAKTLSLEQKVSTMGPDLLALQESQGGFQEFQNKAIKSFILMDEFKEQCENDRRGASLRILGFRSERTGEELVSEIGDFLSNQLDPFGDQTPVILEKVYRLPGRKSSEGKNQVGTVMVSLKDRSVREKILRKAASAHLMSTNGEKVLIFPDVGPATMEKRKELLHLRKKFIELGAQASLWAPARLRVRHMNRQCAFTDPEAARALLESLSEG